MEHWTLVLFILKSWTCNRSHYPLKHVCNKRLQIQFLEPYSNCIVCICFEFENHHSTSRYSAFRFKEKYIQITFNNQVAAKTCVVSRFRMHAMRRLLHPCAWVGAHHPQDHAGHNHRTTSDHVASTFADQLLWLVLADPKACRSSTSPIEVTQMQQSPR